MKILCSYSGIQFEVQHFPAILHARECHHPIFDIPQKKLIQYIKKWSAGELTPLDSYLLYLALLASTDSIVWRTSARFTVETPKIIALNMESLVHVISRLNSISSPAFKLPSIAMYNDTSDLSNSRYWIEMWNSAFDDFTKNYRDYTNWNRLLRLENAIKKLVFDDRKPLSAYAKLLSDWAVTICDFPRYPVNYMGETITCTEYYRRIIAGICSGKNLFDIPEIVFTDIIEYCEENIEHGSTPAKKLMEVLREGRSRRIKGAAISDAERAASVSGSNYTIISDSTTVEEANILAAIQSAPQEAPVRSNYSSQWEYFKAMTKYNMSKRYTVEVGSSSQSDAEIL